MDKLEKLRIFYSLPTISRDSSLKFTIDGRLKVYLGQLIAQYPNCSNPSAIAHLLVRLLRENQNSDRYLKFCVIALLSNIIFPLNRRWLEQDLLSKLSYQTVNLELVDLYGIGLGIISNPSLFLAEFFPSSTLTYYDSLASFSNSKFRRSLIDKLRSLDDLKNFKRTNLGILVRSSGTKLKNALIQEGKGVDRLETLLLIHSCLKLVVNAGKFSTKNPQQVHYLELWARYQDQEGSVNSGINDVEMLKDWLMEMGNSLRNYDRLSVDSLDRQIQGLEGNQVTIADLTMDVSYHNLPEERQIKQELYNLLVNLAIDRDLILLLFEGLELTQREVGEELDCNQTTAKRRYDRIFVDLGTNLYQRFNNQTLSINQLAEIVNYIQEISGDYYGELLLGILGNCLVKSKVKDEVFKEFVNLIESRWKFIFNPEGKGLVKVSEFVDLRL